MSILVMHRNKTRLLDYLVAAVWLINGLFCKVLGLVPRHQQIVARILGGGHARGLTVLIGLLEIAIAVWIVTGKWSKLNAVVQIVIIASMNTLEFILAPDLLLWGRGNSVFALLLIGIVYYNGFRLNKGLALQS